MIIAIVIGSIAKILSIQYVIEDEYVRNQTLSNLQNNASNIVKKADTATIAENDVFSIFKDGVNHQFVTMTGANTSTYKYIDSRGNWVSNTGSFYGTIYTRLFFVEKNDILPTHKQIIKGEVRELIRNQ